MRRTIGGFGHLGRRRAGRKMWPFTVMIISVIAITQLVQRADQLGNRWIVSAISFLAIMAVSWWYDRRLAGPVEQADGR